MIVMAAIVNLVCKHTMLKALIMGIVFQPIKQTEAIFGTGKEQHTCTVQWYTIAVLTLMVIGLIINSRSNQLKKKIVVGYNYHRLERSLSDFEWDHNTIAYISQDST